MTDSKTAERKKLSDVAKLSIVGVLLVVVFGAYYVFIKWPYNERMAAESAAESFLYFRVQGGFLVASAEADADLRCTVDEKSTETVSYSCCDLRKLTQDQRAKACEPDFFATVTGPLHQTD